MTALPLRNPQRARREVERAVAAVRPLDRGAMEQAQGRLDSLTKPPGSLGRLEDLAVALAGITGTSRPRIRRRVVVVCAADHGIAAQGVSAYPTAVTAQMVYNFVRGGAAINVLARRANARVVVADLGVDHDFPPDLPIVHGKVGRGTADMTRGPAMSRDDAFRALAAGLWLAGFVARAHPEGCTAVASGDMGIGN